MIQPDQQYDRITQILQSQATPTAQPLGPIQSANAFLSALNTGGNYSDISSKVQETNLGRERDIQANDIERENNLLKVFEAKRQAGDAQAKALGDKIDLFTGGDPEGQAVFLKALHDDPEEIDAGNSYQVMTKLAKIAKQTGYTSPALQKKNTMDSVNRAITERLGTAGEPKNVRNNNPGNMKSADGGFQAFGSAQDGMKAMQDDLLLKVNGKSKAMEANFGKGYQPTLSNVISTWAPPSENDTGNYVNFVAQKTGIQPDQILSPMDIKKIIPAMIEMEGGQEAAQYYNPVQTADSGQVMNDGVDELTGLQAQLAMASGDQAGALKILENAKKKTEPQSPQGKLAQDYANGIISKEQFDKSSKSETIETDKMDEGKQKFETVVSDISTLLDDLDKEGGIVNTDKNSIANMGRYLANTDGLGPIPGGQTMGKMFGTKEQTIRDKIDAKKKLLSRAIMAATGMSAKQMDSNTELKMFLNSLGDPTSSYQSNKEILRTLSENYGLGSVGQGNSQNTTPDHENMSDDELLKAINGG